MTHKVLLEGYAIRKSLKTAGVIYQSITCFNFLRSPCMINTGNYVNLRIKSRYQRELYNGDLVRYIL